MSSWLVRAARRRFWQPLFIRMQRIAQVGMNHWGGAAVGESGERMAVRIALGRYPADAEVLVFDVGANGGDFLAMVLEERPRSVRVLAFEPAEAAADVLDRRLRTLPGADRVHVERCGMSNEVGVATLRTPTAASSIATLHSTTFELQGRALLEEEISLTTIDTYCEAHGVQRIHYLKVDTEGHEWAVLKGAGRMIGEGRVDHIQFEFGECHLDSRVFFRDFYLALQDQYRIHRILPDGLWPLDEYQPELEVFRTANYLAMSKRMQPHER